MKYPLALALLACTDGNPQYDPDAGPDAGVDAADAPDWRHVVRTPWDAEPDSAPVGPDRDEDGIRDDRDNCPDVANSDQANADEDDNGGDVCDMCPDVGGDEASHTDADGDGQRPCEGDCDDSTAAVTRIFPGGSRDDEPCDGLDNDCDGRTDEDRWNKPLARACCTWRGAGTQACERGRWSRCDEGEGGGVCAEADAGR